MVWVWCLEFYGLVFGFRVYGALEFYGLGLGFRALWFGVIGFGGEG